jgi:hypothetical protein
LIRNPTRFSCSGKLALPVPEAQQRCPGFALEDAKGDCVEWQVAAEFDVAADPAGGKSA